MVMNQIFFKTIAQAARQIEVLSEKNKREQTNLAMQIYWQTYVALAIEEGFSDLDISYALDKLVKSGIKNCVDLVFSPGTGTPKIYSIGKS
jgi:hypothetical protein